MLNRNVIEATQVEYAALDHKGYAGGQQHLLLAGDAGVGLDVHANVGDDGEDGAHAAADLSCMDNVSEVSEPGLMVTHIRSDQRQLTD